MNYSLVRAVAVGVALLCAGRPVNARQDRAPGPQVKRNAIAGTKGAGVRRALQRALYAVRL